MTFLAVGALARRKIVLGVTGSIAAYKAPYVLRHLTAAGAEVQVVMTASAGAFIGAAVFRGLGAKVHTDMFEGEGETHVALARWADAVLIAPATADTLARLRQGSANDLLTATALCADKKVMCAPAMHPSMWSHPATAENVSVLKERGVRFLGPAHGVVASGEVGVGRMEEPENIAHIVGRLLDVQPKLLAGKHIVITAGPTREALDPVRSLTNLSTGKMGYAIAKVALDWGAEVTLISGPVSLPVPPGADAIFVDSALEMQQALELTLGEDLKGADALIMSAAVSDYRPQQKSETKLKRGTDSLHLELTPNPDLLGEIGKRRGGLRPVLVGFALETASADELIQLGRQKLIKKQCDMVVANIASESLGKDEATVRLVSARDCIPLEKTSKVQVAARIMDWVRARLEEPVRPDMTH
jgi:phosphopantothenoylcysteine decarboxylase / phosphopantothenate---cysteine ligase